METEMEQNLWTKVDEYFEELFIPLDPDLESALQDSESGKVFAHYREDVLSKSNSGDWHARRLQYHLACQSSAKVGKSRYFRGESHKCGCGEEEYQSHGLK